MRGNNEADSDDETQRLQAITVDGDEHQNHNFAKNKDSDVKNSDDPENSEREHDNSDDCGLTQKDDDRTEMPSQITEEKNLLHKVKNRMNRFWRGIFVNDAAVGNLIKTINRPGHIRKMKEDAVQAMASDSPVDRISRMGFPLAFFLFNVGYWFQYLYARESQAHHDGNMVHRRK